MAARFSQAAFRTLSSRLPNTTSLQVTRNASQFVPKSGGALSRGGCSKSGTCRQCPGCKAAKAFSVPRAAAALSSQAQPQPTTGRYVAPRISYEGFKVQNVEVDRDRRMLITEWQDGSKSEFPQVWLRDNCQCSACFYEPAVQRLFVMEDLDPAVHITTSKMNDAGDVSITWSDGHASTFRSTWLREHRFTPDALPERERFLPRKPIHWGRELQDNVPSDSFERIMQTDQGLYDWLCTLEETGLFLIKNAPTKIGMLSDLASRVAHLKTTNYGLEHVVMSGDNVSNLTCTNARLGLHTDLPYYNYTPGVQILMCISQVPTKGGESEFADGFHVAEQMRQRYPEEFKLLTEMPVRFFDIGADYYEYHKLHTAPTIELGEEGQIQKISYNNQVRDSIQNMPAEKVNHFYKAMKIYNDLLYENDILLKLEPGQMICFHNFRVLHGRTGFEVLADGVRHLRNGFLDWDVLYSRRRVVQAKLAALKK